MAWPEWKRLRVEQLVLRRAGRRGRRKREAAPNGEVALRVPLLVRSVGGGKYDVISRPAPGEEAKVLAARPSDTVPVMVLDVDDGEAKLEALVASLVRAGMGVFGSAEAARVLVKEHGYSQERVARALGKTQATVSHWLSVFDLDAKVVAALRSGAIGMRMARSLVPLREDRAAQRDVLARIQRDELRASHVERIVAARVRPGAIAMRYAVEGAGRVEVRTTLAGKLRVTLEADDRAGLAKLMRSVDKRLRGSR